MHAPASAQGAALWAAGTACVSTGMAGLELDTDGTIALAREMGVRGWAAAELLTALRMGLAAGAAARRAALTEQGSG